MTTEPTATITLTRAQIGALIDLLLEEAQRMDDDGNEGRFDQSLLRQVYDRVKDSLRRAVP